MVAKTVGELIVEARRHIGEDRFHEAIQLLTSISQEAHTTESLIWLSEAYGYVDDLAMSLLTTRKVLEKDEENVRALVNQTQALLKLGLDEAALESARRGIGIVRARCDTSSLDYEFSLRALWDALTTLHLHEEALTVARELYMHDQNRGSWPLTHSLTATDRITELTVLHGNDARAYLTGLMDAAFHMVFQERYEQASALCLKGLAFTSIPRLEDQGYGFLCYYIESLILCHRYEDALRLITYWQEFPQVTHKLSRKLLALEIAALYSAARKEAAKSLLCKHLENVKHPRKAFLRLRWKLTWDPCMEVLNRVYLDAFPETDPMSFDMTVKFV